MKTPKGYISIRHNDGKQHAVDPGEMRNDAPVWRNAPVCGAATGVSSDEAGPDVTGLPDVTCRDCLGILGGDDDA